MGTKRERLRSANSLSLERLNRLQSIKENTETVISKARIEISRVFNCLNLPESKKRDVLQLFKEIRSDLGPGTKYRNPDKLVPIVIYYYMKMSKLSINEVELLKVAKISKKDFNAFKLQITRFIPKYPERNRQDYIIQKIMELMEHFDLGMSFYYLSKKILNKLWEGIKCTKDDVIAGLVASISVLCSFKGKVTINSICKRLGIKMSTIQSQVKRRIFNRLRISGFVSLVKSSDLLRNVMIRMGIIEDEGQTELSQEIIVPQPVIASQPVVEPIMTPEMAPEILEIKLEPSASEFIDDRPKEDIEVIIEEAKIEISRIFNSLKLPEAKKYDVLELFMKIRPDWGVGTKYRDPDNLVPITIYYCMKLLKLSVNENELLKVAKISEKDFNAFIHQIRDFITKYPKWDWNEYLYVLKNDDGYPLFISLKINNVLDNIYYIDDFNQDTKFKESEDSLFELEIFNFYPGKGPPTNWKSVIPRF